jgi:hypothetical protein
LRVFGGTIKWYVSSKDRRASLWWSRGDHHHGACCQAATMVESNSNSFIFFLYFMEILISYLFLRNTFQILLNRFSFVNPTCNSNIAPTKSILNFYIFQNSKSKTLFKTLSNRSIWLNFEQYLGFEF